jgi:hypothetical protein
MRTFRLTRHLFASAFVLLIGPTAHAVTLSVNCGSNEGLSSIGAAIKALQSSGESHSPSTINVSGACNENVVIRSMDRLTLNAVNGALIMDASGGSADVIQILDSRSASINNFTINGGNNGITCSDGSLCRLNGNTVQNTANDGLAVLTLSQAVVAGGTIQGSGFAGIEVRDGSSAQIGGVMIVNNPGGGIQILGQSIVITNSKIMNNAPGGGVFVSHNGTLRCTGCKIIGNGVGGGNLGVILRRNSSARFSGGFEVTGNEGGGVLITEESSVYFATAGTVTGNSGGMDVFCGSSFTTAKRATTNIGGTTNCVEPSP